MNIKPALDLFHYLTKLPPLSGKLGVYVHIIRFWGRLVLLSFWLFVRGLGMQESM
jgi:hypothetical protein